MTGKYTVSDPWTAYSRSRIPILVETDLGGSMTRK